MNAMFTNTTINNETNKTMTMSLDAAGKEAMEIALNLVKEVARYRKLCMNAEKKLEKEAAELLSLSNEQGALEKELKELVDVLPAKQARLDEIMERKESCTHLCSRLGLFRRKNMLVIEEKEAAELLSLSNEQGELEKKLKEFVDVLPAKQARLDEIMEQKEFCAHRCNLLEALHRKNIQAMELSEKLAKVSMRVWSLYRQMSRLQVEENSHDGQQVPLAATFSPVTTTEAVVAAAVNQGFQHHYHSDHSVGANNNQHEQDTSSMSFDSITPIAESEAKKLLFRKLNEELIEKGCNHDSLTEYVQMAKEIENCYGGASADTTTIPAATATLPSRVSETAVAAAANQEVPHDHGGANQHMYQEDASCTSMRELIEQWTAEEVSNACRMTPSKLKRKLRAMNVVETRTTTSTKLELVQAWVEQVVHRRAVDYYVTRATTEHQTEAFAGPAVAADATAAHTAVLPPAVSAALPPPFDYSNITNMPTANEYRPSAAATEEVATVAALSPLFDPYADMPPLILAEDPPPKNGIWLLTPASSSSENRHDDRVVLHYAFVRASRVKSVQRGFFPKGSVILSAMEGVCWIYAPSTSTAQPNPGAAAAATSARALSNSTTNIQPWELFAVRDINLKVQLFTLEWPGAEAANLVVDGRGAAYVLLPTDPSNASTCDRILIRINSQYEKGKNILPQQLFPCHSRLYRDCAGGVWIHVPNHKQGNNNIGATTRTNEDSDRLSPGIWYITPFEVTCVVRRVSPHAKINLDGNRTGLLLLSPNDGDRDDGDESSLLVHIGSSGALNRCTVAVPFSQVATVLDDGDRGALLHCRSSDNRWRLYRVAWEEVNEDGEVNADAVYFTYCPGRTKIVTDGKGGVWVWKKVGKRNNRALSYISRDGELTENVETFPEGSIMEG